MVELLDSNSEALSNEELLELESIKAASTDDEEEEKDRRMITLQLTTKRLGEVFSLTDEVQSIIQVIIPMVNRSPSVC